MWFEALTGFPEESPQQIRENISVCGNTLTSHINGKVLVCGELETPSIPLPVLTSWRCQSSFGHRIKGARSVAR